MAESIGDLWITITLNIPSPAESEGKGEEEVLCPFDGMRPCIADCPSMQERACVNGP